jgi:hypothetical protein
VPDKVGANEAGSARNKEAHEGFLRYSHSIKKTGGRPLQKRLKNDIMFRFNKNAMAIDYDKQKEAFETQKRTYALITRLFRGDEAVIKRINADENLKHMLQESLKLLESYLIWDKEKGPLEAENALKTLLHLKAPQDGPEKRIKDITTLVKKGPEVVHKALVQQHDKIADLFSFEPPDSEEYLTPEKIRIMNRMIMHFLKEGNLEQALRNILKLEPNQVIDQSEIETLKIELSDTHLYYYRSSKTLEKIIQRLNLGKGETLSKEEIETKVKATLDWLYTTYIFPLPKAA